MGAEYREYRGPRASWEDPPKPHVRPAHSQLQALLEGAGHAAGRRRWDVAGWGLASCLGCHGAMDVGGAKG